MTLSTASLAAPPPLLYCMLVSVAGADHQRRDERFVGRGSTTVRNNVVIKVISIVIRRLVIVVDDAVVAVARAEALGVAEVLIVR